MIIEDISFPYHFPQRVKWKDLLFYGNLWTTRISGTPLHCGRGRWFRKKHANCFTAPMGTRTLSIRGETDGCLLLQGAVGGVAESYSHRENRTEILRGWHGPGPQQRSSREFQAFSATYRERVRGNGG